MTAFRVCVLLLLAPVFGIAADDNPSDIRRLQRDADAALRDGKIEQAVVGFETAVQADPALYPHLWQLGIALYLAGRYDDAAAQFEAHRVVNPHDVENATWHFLCIAKSKSFQAAKESLLPAPGDHRPPMNEVLEMYRTGDEQGVIDAIEHETNPARKASAEFYGNLYRAMYYDAKGDRDAAIQRARPLQMPTPTHYMGDVARHYAEALIAAPRR